MKSSRSNTLQFKQKLIILSFAVNLFPFVNTDTISNTSSMLNTSRISDNSPSNYSSLNGSRIFIPKCCGEGESVEFELESSKPMCNLNGVVEWKPFLFKLHENASRITSEWNNSYTIGYKTLINNVTNFKVLYSSNNTHNLNPNFRKLHWRILADGNIVYLNENSEWKNLTENQNYCIDGLQKIYLNESFYSESENDQILIIFTNRLEEDYEEDDLTWKGLFYATLAYIAAMFYFLTTLVYCILFSKSNSNGWTILGFVGSLFARNILIGTCHLIVHLANNNPEIDFELGTWKSWSIAVVTHFFALSSTFWIALMSFDLMRTIRSDKLTYRGGQLYKFALYCCIGWGLPLLAVCCFVILDNVFENNFPGIITPKYGVHNTFIDPDALGSYFYYIVAVVMVVNFIFIINSILTILSHRKQSQILSSNNQSVSSECLSMKLYLKLFVLTGSLWMLDMISWMHKGVKNPWYYIVTDVLNESQAVWIFIIFVCNHRTLGKLKKKYINMKDSLSKQI